MAEFDFIPMLPMGQVLRFDSAIGSNADFGRLLTNFSMITYNKLGAGYISLKKGNMRTPQDFIIYPYTGGDKILLQSPKRIMQVNISNGWLIINSRNEQNGARGYHLLNGVNTDQLNAAEIAAVREHISRSAGTQGSSVLTWENAPLP